MSSPETKYTELKGRGQDILKKWIFDLVALAVIAASFLLEFAKLSPNEFNLMSWVGDTLVFFFCAMLLSQTYYAKGTLKGEDSDAFISAIKAYSVAASVSGEKRSKLPLFCKEYTQRTLEELQDKYLVRACVSIQEFYNPRKTEGKEDLPAIITMSRKELYTEFGKKRGKLLAEAQRVRIKGLTADGLTSSTTLHDETSLLTKSSMKNKFTLTSATMYIFMGVFFAWFGIGLAQDFSVAALGWFALRLAMMAGRALTAYLTGYEDLATRWRDTLIKKTDILRQFDAWCNASENKIKEKN